MGQQHCSHIFNNSTSPIRVRMDHDIFYTTNLEENYQASLTAAYAAANGSSGSGTASGGYGKKVHGHWDKVQKDGYSLIAPNAIARFAYQNQNGPIRMWVQRKTRDGKWKSTNDGHPIQSDSSHIYNNNDTIVPAKYGTLRVPEYQT